MSIHAESMVLIGKLTGRTEAVRSEMTTICPNKNRVLPKSKKDVILLPGMNNNIEKTGAEPVNTVSTVCRGSITSRPSIWSQIFQRSCFACSEG